MKNKDKHKTPPGSVTAVPVFPPFRGRVWFAGRVRNGFYEIWEWQVTGTVNTFDEHVVIASGNEFSLSDARDACNDAVQAASNGNCYIRPGFVVNPDMSTYHDAPEKKAKKKKK